MAVLGELGAELRGLRLARGLTLIEAARRAGISRKSLQRWEAGSHSPGTAALLRLLDGLGAEARERARLVGTTGPQDAQSALKDSPLGPPAPPGQILRALRELRGLTQSDLARRLGIGQPNVAKWEAGRAMPEEQTLGRALALLGASDAGLREDSLDRYEPLTDPLDARLRLRSEIDSLPPLLQAVNLVAMERELWPLAAREARWEAALVETLAWRSLLLACLGDHTAALEIARRALRLAESSGEWDAAHLVFDTLSEIRFARGADEASMARCHADAAQRLRHPFVRVGFLALHAGIQGQVDRARGRELLERACALVHENKPDELFGSSIRPDTASAIGVADLDRIALATAIRWRDRDEAVRIYERAFAHRWEEAVRFEIFGAVYAQFHRLMGEAPSERARAVLHETWGQSTTWTGTYIYNTDITPWIGADPIPYRPLR